MPVAACAAFGDTEPSVGVARAALVELSIGDVTRTIPMGGVAVGDFPDVPDGTIAPGGAINVNWVDAAFFGLDQELGPIYVSLKPEPGASTSNGMVRSLAAASTATPSSPSDGDRAFFPAVNRNSLRFQISTPDFNNLVWESENPIVNEATITEIPPFETVYNLVEPVEFFPSGDVVLPAGSTPPAVTIKTCNVKMMLLGGIKANVQRLSETDDTATFEATVENETDESEITATWMVWPRPEITVEVGEGMMGVITIGKEPFTFEFTVNRDIFFNPRWFVVAMSQPFDKSASTAVRFPPLD